MEDKIEEFAKWVGEIMPLGNGVYLVPEAPKEEKEASPPDRQKSQ